MQSGSTASINAAVLALFLFGFISTETAAQGIVGERFGTFDPSKAIQPAAQGIQRQRATGIRPAQPLAPSPKQYQHRSTSRNLAGRVTVVALLGIVGASIGGALAAKLEGDCRCDDPGMRGLMIGIPIGAAAGVTAGVMLTR